jgi:CBS domain containing-hemolysin-like protein
MEPSVTEDLLRLGAVFLLVAANGFFVAAEYALVSSSPTRLETMAERGNRLAALVQRAKRDPGRFISGSQLGITMMSLALGWIGEETMAHLIERVLHPMAWFGEGAPIAAHSIAVPVAFFLITMLHIVLGEQVPKLIALQRAEGTSTFAIQPMRIWGRILRPVIALLSWSTNVVLRSMGLHYEAEHAASHSPEELQMLLSRSQHLDETEQDIAARAVEFGDLAVRQVMVPRTELVALPAGSSLYELLEASARTGHSRFPVYRASPDNIAGVVHLRGALEAAVSRPEGESLEECLRRLRVERVMREAITVPETLSVTRLMAEMRRRRQRAAIVMDEYGGTAGFATWEDILERIVGEIPDEFEGEGEGPEIQPMQDGTALVDGRTLIEDVNEHFNLRIEEEGYDTIGGFVFGQLGRKPEVGDEVEANGYRFHVEQLDGLRIAAVRVVPMQAARTTAAEERENAHE